MPLTRAFDWYRFRQNRVHIKKVMDQTLQRPKLWDSVGAFWGFHVADCEKAIFPWSIFLAEKAIFLAEKYDPCIFSIFYRIKNILSHNHFSTSNTQGKRQKSLKVLISEKSNIFHKIVWSITFLILIRFWWNRYRSKALIHGFRSVPVSSKLVEY